MNFGNLKFVLRIVGVVAAWSVCEYYRQAAPSANIQLLADVLVWGLIFGLLVFAHAVTKASSNLTCETMQAVYPEGIPLVKYYSEEGRIFNATALKRSLLVTMLFPTFVIFPLYIQNNHVFSMVFTGIALVLIKTGITKFIDVHDILINHKGKLRE